MPNFANLDNPTEEQEQMAFVQWLRLKGYAHFRVPNETYTKSFKQKAKNKALGVSSGVPDLFAVVPRQQELWNGLGAEAIRTGDTATVPTLVAIEMKRKKGGATSANQKQWLQTLNDAGIQSVVCKGCDEAIKFIESITKSEE